MNSVSRNGCSSTSRRQNVFLVVLIGVMVVVGFPVADAAAFLTLGMARRTSKVISPEWTFHNDFVSKMQQQDLYQPCKSLESRHRAKTDMPQTTCLHLHSTSSTIESMLSSSSSSSSLTVSAATLDPTTFLSDVLGGILYNPVLILAVPIVAALAVASLIAYGIISYANPAESED